MKNTLIIIFLVTVCFNCQSQINSNNYKNLSDKEFNIGDKIILPDIRFELSGGNHIQKICHDSLRIIADFLKKNPTFVIELSAYSDNRGTAKFNKFLSEKRALQVKNYLVQVHSIKEARIKDVGYGEEYPINSEKIINQAKTDYDKEKLHQENRRFELKIIGKIQ